MSRALTTFVAFFICLCIAVPAVHGQVALAGTQTAPHEISGVLQGTLTFVPFAPFGIFDVNSLGVASGQVQALGRSHVFSFHRPTEQGTVVDGHFWIVTASGDKIKGVYEGTTVPGPEPNQLIGNADFQVTGGTGRFTNASGTIHATAYVTVLGFDVFEWPFTWVLEGKVNY